MRKLIFTLTVFSWMNMFSQEQAWPFQNPDLQIDQRIDDLMLRMTSAEKISQLLYNSPGIDRLGIPEYNWWNECLHGVGRAGRATVFPQAIGLAATFDDSLLYRIADAISTEARAKYNEAVKKGNRAQYMGLSFWTPNINIFRDPRWGRGQETYGEDPFLTARMGAAFVRGLQGNDPEHLKAAACAKHFAVHSGPEKTRHEFNAIPEEKDFRETYLPAFKALSDAGVEAVMCAYNRLYDEPCCGSKYLLKEILRDEWGFQGHIVTDCWALDDIWLRHKTVATREESAAMAARAGVNLNCGYIYKYLPDAIEKGLIGEPTIDSILRPLLRTRFRLGLFDPPELSPWAGLTGEVVNSPEHQALAYEAASKSIVLLQNKGNILPLDRDSISGIFIAGPTAADILALTGNYTGWSGDMVTFLEGITRAVDAGTKVDYSPGCRLSEPGAYTGFWEAQMADVIVVCLGNTRMLEGEEGDAMLNQNGGDRSGLRLPESQREYIRLLREKVPGKPIIAVVTGGSAIALQEVLEAADAVLFAWYPGELGGAALADILFGKVNPSGKLPVTFYRSVDDLPPFDDYSMKGRTYKYFEGEPLFPFGYGLSYTTFDIVDLKVDKEILHEGERLQVGITVKNTGEIPGEEVLTIYAAQITGDQPPVRHLVGFSRVLLNAGEIKTIIIETDLLDMYLWDTKNKRYYVRTGEYLLGTDLYGRFDKFVKFSVR
ncbi:MAG: glycoside hydrolase family 3 C-terminal domain-containing protein [Bacteroidales bacterium]|jgi:beta-glucosidase|nr:glycoside hydrolase family 3 C-terminal domain-containing protein [Bacteroidales bacterium]